MSKAALKVRTQVKAGGMRVNHTTAQGLRVRTEIKAGGLRVNHSHATGQRRGVTAS